MEGTGKVLLKDGGTLVKAEGSQEAGVRRESIPGIQDSQGRCPEFQDGIACVKNSREASVLT